MLFTFGVKVGFSNDLWQKCPFNTHLTYFSLFLKKKKKKHIFLFFYFLFLTQLDFINILLFSSFHSTNVKLIFLFTLPLSNLVQKKKKKKKRRNEEKFKCSMKD